MSALIIIGLVLALLGFVAVFGSGSRGGSVTGPSDSSEE